MKKEVENVEEYILAVDPAKKKIFHQVLQLIKSTHPQPVLSFKYNMLHFSIGQQWIALADQMHYVSVYLNRHIMEKYKSQLEGYNCGKSCLRLHPKKEVPEQLLLLLIRESLSAL